MVTAKRTWAFMVMAALRSSYRLAAAWCSPWADLGEGLWLGITTVTARPTSAFMVMAASRSPSPPGAALSRHLAILVTGRWPWRPRSRRRDALRAEEGAP